MSGMTNWQIHGGELAITFPASPTSLTTCHIIAASPLTHDKKNHLIYTKYNTIHYTTLPILLQQWYISSSSLPPSCRPSFPWAEVISLQSVTIHWPLATSAAALTGRTGIDFPFSKKVRERTKWLSSAVAVQHMITARQTRANLWLYIYYRIEDITTRQYCPTTLTPVVLFVLWGRVNIWERALSFVISPLSP